jgi:hypothetical protein
MKCCGAAFEFGQKDVCGFIHILSYNFGYDYQYRADPAPAHF